MLSRPLLHIALLQVVSFFVPGVAALELDAASFVQAGRWRYDDSDESTRDLVARYNVSTRVMQQASYRHQGALAAIHAVWCGKLREALEKGIAFTELAECSSMAFHEAINETHTMDELDELHRLAENSGFVRLMKLLGTKAPHVLDSGTEIHLQTWTFRIGTGIGFNLGNIYDEFYFPYTPVPIGKLSKLVHGEKDQNRIVAVGVGISGSASITWGQHNEKQICGSAKIDFPTTDVGETWNDLTLGGAIFENQKGWSIHFAVGRDYDGVDSVTSSWKSLDQWVRGLVGKEPDPENALTLGGSWELDFEFALASPVAMAGIDLELCWNEGMATPDLNQLIADGWEEDMDEQQMTEINPYLKNPATGQTFDKDDQDKMMSEEEVLAAASAVRKDRLLRRNALTGSPAEMMEVMDGVRSFMKEAHKFQIPKKFPIVYPQTFPASESMKKFTDRTVGLFECHGGFKKWKIKPFATSMSFCHMWGFKRD